jgi:hypothetical protein
MKGGHKGHISYVWSWGELNEDQQAIVNRKLAGACGASSLERLWKHCGAVMTDGDNLQIVINVPLDGFSHQEMES